MTDTTKAAQKRGVAISERMSPEQLAGRLAQRGTKFGDKRTKRKRSRGDQRRHAIREG